MSGRPRHVRWDRMKTSQKAEHSHEARQTHGTECRARPPDAPFDPVWHGQMGATLLHTYLSRAVRVFARRPDTEDVQTAFLPHSGGTAVTGDPTLQLAQSILQALNYRELCVGAPEWQVPAIAPTIWAKRVSALRLRRATSREAANDCAPHHLVKRRPHTP